MRTWPSPLPLFHRVGIVTFSMTFPLLSSLLSIILSANAWQKFNCGSGSSLQAHACKFTAFTSAIPIKNVNCLVGHHLVRQVWSSPIGAWHQLLWSSTRCLAQLWCEIGFDVQWNDPGFHQGCHASSSFLLRSLHPLCSELKNQYHQFPVNWSL